MSFGSTLEPDNQIAMMEKVLNKWLKNPPDYDDVHRAYKKRGELQSRRIKVVRDINRIEDDVAAESDKPRSNDTRQRKLTATRQLKDDLAEVEADIAIHDNDVKFIEYRKDMYKSATWHLKQLMEM
jgi:hypothetical protein